VQPLSSPMSVVERVLREVERNALRVRNGIRLAAGIRPQGVGQTPKEIVWRRGRTELWRYRRRAGVGRALARHALIEAVRAGRRKLVVELAADQEKALAMFSSLGFTGEALLRDHIRDRDGELHDLVMLAHFVEGMWAGMGAIGLSDELGLPEA
jgi:RimJ/RimL family protein N-acetyltransferase